VSRGASFESQGKGTWRDLAEIPVDTVAEFILRNDGEMSSNAPYVTGEVTETAGKHLVYRTTELMIVIPKGAKDVYIMSTQNDPNDPLGSALQLLKSTNVLAEWRANPIRFYELVGTGPEAGKDFALQIDEKFKLGNFNKALKGIRTGAGKFFDFINPFEGSNIEVNFKFTEFGPALVRADVFGGKGGRVQAGGLTDKDLKRLADTDYFRYETLGGTNDTDYKFKKRFSAPPDPIDAKPKTGSSKNYAAEGTQLDIDADGRTRAYSDQGLPSMTSDYGFGRALWIFLKGFLEGKSAAPVDVVQSAEQTTQAPAAAGQTVAEFIKQNEGQEVCPGAAYFDFNEDASKSDAEYVGALNAAIDKASIGLSDVSKNKLAITLVATADSSGTEKYNKTLANKRNTSITSKIKNAEVYRRSLGEDLWPADWVEYAHPAPESASLRFVKAYWGEPADDALKAAIIKFATDNSGGKITESKNQVAEARLRAYIRRMLLNE
jgi:hypothetical protein